MKKISTILSPFFVGMFLFPVLVHAESATTTTEETGPIATTTVIVTKAQLFTGCSQDAIELRDTKLAQARSTYNNAMNALLLERKNTEKAAVAIEDEKEKKAAVKESVEKYKTEVKTIQNTLTQSRKTIWQNFENDTKKCRVHLEKEEDSVTKEEKQVTKEVARKEVTDTKEVKKEEKKEDHEQKTVKESIIDSIKSLFNKDN
jgi:uncharacterized protein with GYD domain